jgi:ribonucleotide monophosphatase NagD (HAD superfamily)
MICANPDKTAINHGVQKFMPGFLAQRYVDMGGELLTFGKPYLAFFHNAIGFRSSSHSFSSSSNTTDYHRHRIDSSDLSEAHITPSNIAPDPFVVSVNGKTFRKRRRVSRVLHVGDSIEHDIAGESDSVLNHKCADI